MGSIPASAAKRDRAVWPAGEPISCWQCGADRASKLVLSRLRRHPTDSRRTPTTSRSSVSRAAWCTIREVLQRRYYELHRQLHPDRYQTGPQGARSASLRNTAAVNRAYRTLRDPVERGEYWLTLHGETLGANNNRVPPELAALVFEVQEKLEELRAARRRKWIGGSAARRHRGARGAAGAQVGAARTARRELRTLGRRRC